MATDMPPCKRCICMLSIKCFSKSECFFRSSYSNKYLQDQQCLLWCHGLFPHVQQGFSSGFPAAVDTLPWSSATTSPAAALAALAAVAAGTEAQAAARAAPGGRCGCAWQRSRPPWKSGVRVYWFDRDFLIFLQKWYMNYEIHLYIYIDLSGSFSQLPASSFTDSRISTNLIVGRWEECDSFIKTPNQKMGWQGQTWLAMAERWDKPSGSFRLVH